MSTIHPPLRTREGVMRQPLTVLTLQADPEVGTILSDLAHALSALPEVPDSLVELVERLLRALETGVGLDLDVLPTGRAGHIRVTFKFRETLLELVSALRARNIDRELVGGAGHLASPVGFSANRTVEADVGDVITTFLTSVALPRESAAGEAA